MTLNSRFSVGVAAPCVRLARDLVSSRAMVNMRPATLALTLLLLVLSGCANRSVTTTVYNHNRIKVLLRSEIKSGELVERGFQHPSSISEQRLASILSQIEFRGKDDAPNQQRQLFAPSLVPGIASGLSKALAEADPNQEIALMAVHKHFSLGVFTRKSLTSFVSYVEGDDLYILFSRVDWSVEAKATKGGSKEVIPVPRANEQVMKFGIIAREPLEKAGNQGVRTVWRDRHWGPMEAIASEPAGVESLGLEREVLEVEAEIVSEEQAIQETAETAETQKEKAVVAATPSTSTRVDDEPLPYPTSPAGLRALADLEEARQAGTISETEYRQERRALAK